MRSLVIGLVAALSFSASPAFATDATATQEANKKP